jgi:hypothetical protein
MTQKRHEHWSKRRRTQVEQETDGRLHYSTPQETRSYGEDQAQQEKNECQSSRPSKKGLDSEARPHQITTKSALQASL